MIKLEIVRFNERSKASKDPWISSHSYLVLTNGASHSVFQASAQNYTLQEWLEDEQSSVVSQLPLDKHFKLLADLHCESKEESKANQKRRGECYSLLIRKKGDEVPSKDYPMKLYYSIKPFPIRDAIIRINFMARKIEELLNNSHYNSNDQSIAFFLQDKILEKAGVNAENREILLRKFKEFADLQRQAEASPYIFFQ